MASAQNSIQMGSAVRAPSWPRPRLSFFSSNPTQTPAASDGSKPMNQPSVKSLVVPVLPAIGRFSARARIAVPRSTTPRSRLVSR